MAKHLDDQRWVPNQAPFAMIARSEILRRTRYEKIRIVRKHGRLPELLLHPKPAAVPSNPRPKQQRQIGNDGLMVLRRLTLREYDAM
jgi:hypothetical protein